jgi:transposase-like protein
MDGAPSTLLEAVQYFADETVCIEYLAKKRWPSGVVVCPICGKPGAGYLAKQKRWQCSARHPKRQFSIKVGTIMEDSPIPLPKWLPVLWLIANCRNGISSWEIHRDLGVTQKTAWFMLQRARLAMQDDLTGGMLGGEVEVDETFIGGKIRNMHKARKVKAQKTSQKGDKAIVLGILERETTGKKKKVRATVISDRKGKTMKAEVGGIVEKGATIYSDEFASAWRMDEDYEHQIVNHLECYVDGQVHTNGLENFWSLLKRGLSGTYVAVEPFHLFRYVDEQAFRFSTIGSMRTARR